MFPGVAYQFMIAPAYIVSYTGMQHSIAIQSEALYNYVYIMYIQLYMLSWWEYMHNVE
jgi:hypothetical protein